MRGSYPSQDIKEQPFHLALRRGKRSFVYLLKLYRWPRAQTKQTQNILTLLKFQSQLFTYDRHVKNTLPKACGSGVAEQCARVSPGCWRETEVWSSQQDPEGSRSGARAQGGAIDLRSFRRSVLNETRPHVIREYYSAYGTDMSPIYQFA